VHPSTVRFEGGYLEWGLELPAQKLTNDRERVALLQRLRLVFSYLDDTSRPFRKVLWVGGLDEDLLYGSIDLRAYFDAHIHACLLLLESLAESLSGRALVT
jgi:hypothetical protein